MTIEQKLARDADHDGDGGLSYTRRDGNLAAGQLGDGFEINSVATFDAKFAGLRSSGGYPDDNQPSRSG